MKYISLILAMVLFASGTMFARELSLDYCTTQALAKSPLQKKKLYYKTKSELEQESVTSNYFPQISLDAQATYQSDVIEFSFPFPGAESPYIPNEQYKISLNLRQMIWDGGITSSRNGFIEAENNAKLSEVEVSLYPVKEMISDLYFKILFLQKSLKTLELNAKQLDTNRHVIESLVRNGVMYRSNLDNISIQILRVEQKIDEVKVSRSTLIKMLAEWIEEPIDGNDVLKVPEINSVEYTEIKRPEYELFASHEKLLDESKDLVSTKIMPKIFAFGLAGFGAPNQFNLFESDASFYWMAGVKFQWTPFDWSSSSNKKQSIDVQKNILMAERETFDKKLKIELIRQKEEIGMYQQLMDADNEIIKRQENIVKEYFSRLKNSTITVTDYLLQVNSLLKSQINYEMHKLQKISAEVKLLTKTGNI
jgi:outer membrane protein TolC